MVSARKIEALLLGSRQPPSTTGGLPSRASRTMIGSRRPLRSSAAISAAAMARSPAAIRSMKAVPTRFSLLQPLRVCAAPATTAIVPERVTSISRSAAANAKPTKRSRWLRTVASDESPASADMAGPVPSGRTLSVALSPVTTPCPNQPLTRRSDPGVVDPALAGHAVVPLAGGGLLLALGAIALEGRVVGAVLAPMIIAATGEGKSDRHDHNPPQRHSPPLTAALGATARTRGRAYCTDGR